MFGFFSRVNNQPTLTISVPPDQDYVKLDLNLGKSPTPEALRDFGRLLFYLNRGVLVSLIINTLKQLDQERSEIILKEWDMMEKKGSAMMSVPLIRPTQVFSQNRMENSKDD
jgi:hypothetical protein